jgi:hypothetical protein
MKHWIAGLSLVVALVVTGCDTVNHSQIQVVPPKTERGTPAVATVPAAERMAVKQVLTEIAVKHRFEDRTDLSLIPETICSFAQPDVKHPLRIVAWVTKDRISIDLFQKPPGTGETIAYRNLREEVMSALDKQFGSRLKLIHKMDQATGGPAGS